MLCQKCINIISGNCYTEAFTEKLCDLCNRMKVYPTGYNPKYCCESCSSFYKECENCGENLANKVNNLDK